MSKSYKIALIGGDGVGPEVVSEGRRVLEHVAKLDAELSFEFKSFPWGCEYYKKTGEMMPKNGMEVLKDFDSIILGAVGQPDVPDHISLRGLLIEIRKGFDQYVNLRPVKLLKGAPCPILGARREDIDMIYVRENTEGEYAGLGGIFEDRAEQTGVFTRKGCERVIRYAFELARKEGRSITSVSKANALNYSMVFWDKIFAEVGEDYPDVEKKELLVDATSMFMVREPERFGVVVCSNLFGDILTDLGAAIAGGMGIAAGANINPEKLYPSMFEPVHGSAPDIAGQGKANPMATIWSVSQMMDHFGREDLGKQILDAIEAVLIDNKYRTPDIGGNSCTKDVTDAIIEKII